ncbi:MAG: hypothetical protein AB7G80_02390 [Dongiaceae bacterium]
MDKPLQGLRILFLNDEPRSIAMRVRAFSEAGAAITKAEDVEQAVDALLAQTADTSFHVLISDIRLPKGLAHRQKHPEFFTGLQFGPDQLGLDFIRIVRQGREKLPAHPFTKLSIVVHAMEMEENYGHAAFECQILEGFSAHYDIPKCIETLALCRRFHVLGDRSALDELQPSKPGHDADQHPIERKLERGSIHPYYRDRGYGD